MKLKTSLLSGAGNTFHICLNSDLGTANFSLQMKKNLAKLICETEKADGFIFLKKNEEGATDYAWEFYNNDGSDAEMCGNATRCVGYYLANVILAPKSNWSLLTSAGNIQIEKLDFETFKIGMTEIIQHTSTKGSFFDTGVPHLVLELENYEKYKSKKSEAAALRFHPEFSPKGTNVTYVELAEDLNKMKAVSYERGVEDFTEACGTGAMAAAMYNLIKRGSLKTEVEMPGGTLIMDLSDTKKPKMTGPAKLLGSFEYEV